VFFATEDFLKTNPNTAKAVLRAFVKAVRLAKADKERAVKILVDQVGMAPDYAARGYDDFIDNIYEDGRLPSDAGMASFWDIGVQAGDYDAPWPLEKFWDPTFVDTYEQWKPAQ
jgi:NitT/TauT family transport system substrate-binding protein